MGIRRLLMLLLLVLGSIPIAASPASACSCAVGGGLDRADLAFVGVVRSVHANGTGERVEFAVESVLKGKADPIITVRTAAVDSAACGVRFAEGGRYQVFSAAGRTDLCSGNQVVSTGLAAADHRPRSSMRWPMILAAGAGVLILVIGAELLWLSREPKLHPGPGRRAPGQV
jgi:hypothetical protein